MWKKTFKTIHQLSCFVGHQVCFLFSFQTETIQINFFKFSSQDAEFESANDS